MLAGLRLLLQYFHLVLDALVIGHWDRRISQKAGTPWASEIKGIG